MQLCIEAFFHEKELKLDLMEKLSDHHPGGMDYITFQINFSTMMENIWNQEIPLIDQPAAHILLQKF